MESQHIHGSMPTITVHGAEQFQFKNRSCYCYKGPFKCYVTQMGVGGVRFSGKKQYEGIALRGGGK